MAVICDNLSDLLREYGRYSEAAFLTRQTRYLHRLLLPSFWRNFFAYPEWVLRSPWHFICSFSMVFIVFFAYWLAIEWGYSNNESFSKTFAKTFAKSYEVLVCDQPDLSWPGMNEEHKFVITHQLKKGKNVAHSYNPLKKKQDKIYKNNFYSRFISTLPVLSRGAFPVVVHTMRQISLLHLAFLGLSFWDVMRRK